MLYEIRSAEAKDGKIVGQADFVRTATGEVRGNPMTFTYDPSDETLIDGSATSKCSNLQDKSLLELPQPDDEANGEETSI